MASLQELLSKEGFDKPNSRNKKLIKPRDRLAPDDSIALPIYICHDRRSLDSSKQRRRSTTFTRSGSSNRVGSSSERSDLISRSTEAARGDEPAIDEVAVRAVISILSGYIGRYVRDREFRETIREKYESCLAKKGLEKSDCDNIVLQNMELGIRSIEKLVEDREASRKEIGVETLRKSVELLSIVASVNTKKSRNSSTCGTPNSHLSACAQLYLSIIYKLEKNDRICSRHLLQVFCDAPFLARTHLLPELWDHLFLPHLLHLKVWYSAELDKLVSSGYGDKEKEKHMKVLSRLYNENVDLGTTQFAHYYKNWLKVGAKAPALPQVALPARPSSGLSRRRSSDSFASNSSINKSLYRAVFGPTLEKHSMDLDGHNGASIDTCGLEEEEKVSFDKESYKFCNYALTVQDQRGSHRRSSSQISCRKSHSGLWRETQKPSYLQLFGCHGVPTECIVQGNSTRKESADHLFTNDVSNAINTLCSSEILSDCESAIRVITKAWLDSHRDPIIEIALLKASVIEGMLEVLFASNNDEILELVISILAEFVTRKEVIGQIILNSDPHLEIFIRLLRNSSLFLKAAVLLHLLKPEAKQMTSIEWVPLVLRVLEFGNQLQTLFTVRCSPQEAALYFLDQLLTGFDEDRNLDNARQVVLVGGLNLLVKRIEAGNPEERNRAALIISRCIEADGSCRNYLAENLNKASILELIIMQMNNSYKCAFTLLTELLCLDRRSQITKLLYGLKNSMDGMNVMQILFAYLQKALPLEVPLAASVLLQLDLLGEPLKSSVYREEAVEAIIAALDCEACNEEVQQQSARALLILGGHFGYTGEPTVEQWMLRKAGFDERSEDSTYSKDIVIDTFLLPVSDEEEDDAAENWQRKAAIVLLNSGNKRLLTALSNAIANGIPSLARASLATVAWITYFLHSFGDENFRSMACSVLMPSLLESLNYDKDLEERVLASHSLYCLVKSSECVGMLTPLLDKETVGLLRNLSLVTWTATELISILRFSSD